MTLLVGDARSTASCGHWSESLPQGGGGFLPARWKPGRFQVGQNENHAPSKYCQAREGICISVPEMSLTIHFYISYLLFYALPVTKPYLSGKGVFKNPPQISSFLTQTHFWEDKGIHPRLDFLQISMYVVVREKTLKRSGGLSF